MLAIVKPTAEFHAGAPFRRRWTRGPMGKRTPAGQGGKVLCLRQRCVADRAGLALPARPRAASRLLARGSPPPASAGPIGPPPHAIRLLARDPVPACQLLRGRIRSREIDCGAAWGRGSLLRRLCASGRPLGNSADWSRGRPSALRSAPRRLLRGHGCEDVHEAFNPAMTVSQHPNRVGSCPPASRQW